MNVIALNGAGLQDVQAFALRHALDDVDQNDVGQFLIGNAHSAVRADISGAYNGYFFSHRWGTQAELYLAHLQGSPSHQHGVRIDEHLHRGLTQIQPRTSPAHLRNEPISLSSFPR